MQIDDPYEYFVEQHRLMHLNQPSKFSGKSVVPWIPMIDQICLKYHCDTLLDYGCGQAQHWPDHWLDRITGYDPCVPRFQHQPQPADCVISCDVMEHIHHSGVHRVAQHIASLAGVIAVIIVSFNPADRRLPDRTNSVHVTVRPREWWCKVFEPYSNCVII